MRLAWAYRSLPRLLKHTSQAIHLTTLVITFVYENFELFQSSLLLWLKPRSPLSHPKVWFVFGLLDTQSAFKMHFDVILTITNKFAIAKWKPLLLASLNISQPDTSSLWGDAPVHFWDLRSQVNMTTRTYGSSRRSPFGNLIVITIQNQKALAFFLGLLDAREIFYGFLCTEIAIAISCVQSANLQLSVEFLQCTLALWMDPTRIELVSPQCKWGILPLNYGPYIRPKFLVV